MEMSFPHHALRTFAETTSDSRRSVLDAARARQAKSRTVRALNRAENGNAADADDLAARIHCFVADPDADIAVRGAFWQKPETAKMNEDPVYQSGSVNIKYDPLSAFGTGTDSNLAGHGAKNNHD